MEKIQYYYPSMSKQVFLILLMLLIAARFTIFLEVIFFDINDYTSTYNIGASLLLYLFYLVICLFFFFGYKFFYTTYNEDEIIYHNCILRKTKRIDFHRISKAVLGKRGITLYEKEGESALFFLPFFRLGLISPVGVDGFYKLLKAKNLSIEKQFTILPGHGISRKIASVVYSCLALFVLASLTQSVALAVAILKNN